MNRGCRGERDFGRNERDLWVDARHWGREREREKDSSELKRCA